MLQFFLKYNGILVVLHVSHRMFMQLPSDPFLSVLVVLVLVCLYLFVCTDPFLSVLVVVIVM